MVRFFNRLPTATLWGLAVFLVIWIHGGNIGLTDDEAYYWVLAQSPDWGYAYHPPMVAWLIALAQKILGPVTGNNSPWVVRFWSAASMGAIFFMGIRWLESLGAQNRSPGLQRAGWVFAAIPGLFFLSWMMVPDTSLFLFWTLLFTSTWSWCNRPSANLEHWTAADLKLLVGAAIGAAGIVLSKYSGVLAVFSAAVMAVLYVPQDALARRWRAAGPMLAALILGLGLACIPIIVWNAQHDWQSLLYQLRDRHRGDLTWSWVRGLRFWLIQMLAVGPAFIAIVVMSARSAWTGSSMARVIWIWALPAALVFWVQPFLSEFKPHWAFAAWWPFVWLLAADAISERRWSRWLRWQLGYGFVLGSVVTLACYQPIVSAFVGRYLAPRDPERWTASRQMLVDVTNDLYGWAELPAIFDRIAAAPSGSLIFGEKPVVVGSRYQTASQASFALGARATTLWVPRDLGARDEWPLSDRVDAYGPEWPSLTGQVIYVADNRYDAPPTFKNAACEALAAHYEYRALMGSTFLAKKLLLWRCVPQSSRP